MHPLKLIHRTGLLSAALALLHFSCAADDSTAIYGFTAAGGPAQRELEKKFDAAIRKENLRQWMQWITRKPHHLGSPHGHEVAKFIAEKFKSWGYETEIEEFRVLFPTPKERSLELLAPHKFTARLSEPVLKEDGTSGVKGQLPPYNAYSIDGDVTGGLVYVNYGVPGDYEVLAEHGIDVKGRIVIARYGGSWRGIKPKVAAEHGAIGCLIYSDPREDGYFQGDVYPKGAFRNETGAQRGSVADIPLYSGDPLTPGVGATKDARRLALSEAPTLTKIPVLPISYADALPLLHALDGAVVPSEWRGGLPITYHFGPGPARVHLRVKFNWDLVPLYDVVARLRGVEEPDQWIVRGNHHDAWVMGANDPVSGTVELMEEARVIAGLAKAGHRPRRTILFTVWDGEEPGLIGSTEWAETHAAELQQKVVAYLNGDNTGRGFLHASGSHTLERFVNEIAREVIDPQTKATVAERLRALRISSAGTDERRALRASDHFHIGALGSGSDFTPFLQHLGISALDLRFGGEDDAGVYHSTYDSFDHYLRFGDPEFDYGATLAKTTGRAILRLANADYLPFDFTCLADTVMGYAREVAKLADDRRVEAEERARLIKDHTMELARDPQDHLRPLEPLPAVPPLDFSALKNATSKLQASASNYARAAGVLQAIDPARDRAALSALNQLLLQNERWLVHEAGLPRRPWYKHLVYAPGFYTGYGVKTLPGVREAIEQGNWDEAVEQIQVAARALERFAMELDRATAAIPTR